MEKLTTLAALDVYVPNPNNPWDASKIHHLYKRVGFGATPKMIQEGVLSTPDSLVENLIREALNKNTLADPEWIEWKRSQFYTPVKIEAGIRTAYKIERTKDLLTNNLNKRLFLFWSNHFVTEEINHKGPPLTHRYSKTLSHYALGNFKEFTRAIGKDGAMLIYLDGRNNVKGQPNENYARELYELFTLGVDNGYTQNDIIETAKALTGWDKRAYNYAPYTFNPAKFDATEKTIFGRKGNWGYDDVIDILFDVHGNKIAKFICGKLYRYFVNPVPKNSIINQLATVFVANNFELAPVLRVLFKSQHFFATSNKGVLIKSPLDIAVMLIKESEVTTNIIDVSKNILFQSGVYGQALLNPPNVAGWTGDKSWISASHITGRWSHMRAILISAWKNDQEQFRAFAFRIVGNTNDVEKATSEILNFFLAKPLFNRNEFEQALDIFKDNVPENYFEEGQWDLNWPRVPIQVYRLLLHIVKIPEFQLK